MKVLVVHNEYRSQQPSGENAVVSEEARLLEACGVEVRRLTARSDEIAGWSFPRRLALPVQVVWSWPGYRQTRDAIAAFEPDVVHFHNTFPLLSPAAVRAGGRSRAAVVHTLHNFRPLCPSANLFREGRICEECVGRTPVPAVRYGCYKGSRLKTLPVAVMDAMHAAAGSWDQVDVFIALSHFMRRKYVEAGWPGERMEVKYNAAPDSEARRTGPGNTFVCVARLVPEKGVDVLLRAWARAFPGGEETLVVGGSGELEREIRAAGELPGVRFVGHLKANEVVELMLAARAVVVPSLWYEPFGRTVAESYSVGVPVIASRIGTLTEIVKDGDTGMLVEPGSADDLARALRIMATRPNEALRMGRQARELYEAEFNPAATTSRLLEIYDLAIANGLDARDTRNDALRIQTSR
jgi:glycosyltransferase involved in cell wall biosynthesis